MTPLTPAFADRSPIALVWLALSDSWQAFSAKRRSQRPWPRPRPISRRPRRWATLAPAIADHLKTLFARL